MLGAEPALAPFLSPIPALTPPLLAPDHALGRWQATRPALRGQWEMRGKAGSSFPPCPPAAHWVSFAKPVASWVPVSLSDPGTAYQREKMFFPVYTFPSYWLRGPRTVSQDRHSFPAQHQTPVLVPLTSQLCRVPDSLSQLTPGTTHPSWVRPDLQRWPESRG